MAYISDNDKLFFSKLDDGIYLSEKRQRAYFFPFFTEREQALAERYLVSVGFHRFAFFGGYEGAERKMLGLFFYEEEEFPLCAVRFSFRKSDKLSHRDFLGAIMSLGVERETVGDILVEDGSCVVFVRSEIRDYIVSQIFKIGNVGVKIGDLNGEQLPRGRDAEERDYTVSSLRLDAVVAAITGLSREKTKSLILSGSVALEHIECKNVSQAVGEHDTVTVRGKGKFKINGVRGETKKHRIRISIIHYR